MKQIPGAIVTMGTFDGLHRGHRALFRRVRARSRFTGWPGLVLVFARPPRHFFSPPQSPDCLMTPQEKMGALRTLGNLRVCVIRFNRRVAVMPPEKFFEQWLLRRCHSREIVVGSRLVFGRGRRGRLAMLKKLGRKFGVPVHLVGPVRYHGHEISSQSIRLLLRQGRVELASSLLGAPYSVTGVVVRGAGRGRRLGFPTINLRVPREKILPPGVHVVRWGPRGPFGVCNVGTRPTFTPRGTSLHVEVFFLNPRRAKRVRVGQLLQLLFLKRLRPERRFSSPEALVKQIQRDVHFALLFRRNLID